MVDAMEKEDITGNVSYDPLNHEHMVKTRAQKIANIANEIPELTVAGPSEGDLLVIDIKAAFIYDPDYEEVLEFFEFGNIQDLELRYFDRLLDQQLTMLYEGKRRKVPAQDTLSSRPDPALRRRNGGTESAGSGTHL